MYVCSVRICVATLNTPIFESDVRIFVGTSLARSMSRLSRCSDNPACKGLFGRLKDESSYGRNWSTITSNKFISQLNDYINWYNTQNQTIPRLEEFCRIQTGP
ncbi:IS3 family transposase [Atopobium sp. oral taxon 416]|nr:IS3 family transposase [Atopobium sp. oral taxon 416]